jgi:hypothetical protein
MHALTNNELYNYVINSKPATVFTTSCYLKLGIKPFFPCTGKATDAGEFTVHTIY